MNNIEDIIIPYKDLLKRFTRKDYSKSFMEYEEKCKENIKVLQHEYDDSEDRNAYLNSQAERIVLRIKEESIDNKSISRSKANRFLEDYRLIMLFYTIPMLSRANGYASKKLVEALITAWPEAKLKVSSYEKLSDGFKTSFFENIFGRNK